MLVVLVIIALLAAILLPFAFEQIDEAKANAEIAETRTIVVGMQTLMTLSYANDLKEKLLDKTDIYNVRLSALGKRELDALLNTETGEVIHIRVDSLNTVLGLLYVTEKGSRVVYDNGEYAVEDLY